MHLSNTTSNDHIDKQTTKKCELIMLILMGMGKGIIYRVFLFYNFKLRQISNYNVNKFNKKINVQKQ